jgi:hypothetical protein
MKGVSNLLITISGFVAAPFLVYLLAKYIDESYPWIPFLIVLVFASILGVGMLKGAGAGLVVGAVLFGALLVWYPRALDFLPPYVRHIRAPF